MTTQRPQSLRSTAGVLALGRASGVSLALGVQGFGLPGIQPQWSEGAGDGRKWRGSRVLARKVPLRFNIRGTDRADVLNKFSNLARIIAPQAGLTRFTVSIGGEAWWIDMTRTDLGDFDWDTGTDGDTVLMVPITFETEDPYWTREDSVSVQFKPNDVTRGLLTGTGSMVAMRLSSTTSLGAATLINPGDVATPPLVHVDGPFSGFHLTGASGELVESTADRTVGHWIEVDMAAGTAVDDLGVNVFDTLNDLPEFWDMQPGTSVVTLQIDDATAASGITLYLNPRRWVLF